MAGGAQHGVEHCRDGPFAVRAGDMDGLEGTFRMIEGLAQHSHAVETELHPEPFEGEQEIDGRRSHDPRTSGGTTRSEGPIR